MNSLRIAWRNIWRNGRRTAITASAIAFCTATLIATFGLMDGMRQDMIHNITRLVLGEVQIHAEGYRSDHSMYKAIADPAALEGIAREHGFLSVRRSYGYGLVSSGSKSAGAQFWGVDPAAEAKAFELARSVDRGRFLDGSEGAESDGRYRPVVLGKKLAKVLQAEPGSEIVVVVQAADGSMGNELFTVWGVLKSCGEDIDRAAAIILAGDFEDLFVSNGRIHEIALVDPAGRDLAGMAQVFSAHTVGNEIRTWRQLNPSLSDMVEMFATGMWIFAAIFFLAAGLGVTNTMLMATYERIREFGVLKALGSSPWRILRDVSIEALLLGLFAGVIGFVVGALGTWWLAVYGIDLNSLGSDVYIEGVAYNMVWKATLTARNLMAPGLVMLLICVLAALYPAAKAARLDPVRAMSHT